MKKVWIIVLVIVLGIVGFIAYYNRWVDFYFQDNTIRNNLFILNANSIPEELRIIGSIDAEIFSWVVTQDDSVALLDKIHLDDDMLWYRLIFSYGDGMNLYIRVTGRDVWYFDVYGKYWLWPCYNKNSRCGSILDMIIHTRVPHKVQDIVLVQDNKQTVLLWTGGNRLEQVKRWP